jgi:hypothetical protein
MVTASIHIESGYADNAAAPTRSILVRLSDAADLATGNTCACGLSDSVGNETPQSVITALPPGPPTPAIDSRRSRLTLIKYDRPNAYVDL